MGEQRSELARGADVLLCESTWSDGPERPPGVHLSGRQAGRTARQAGVERLLLTHVPAWADGPALLAEARSHLEQHPIRPDLHLVGLHTAGGTA